MRQFSALAWLALVLLSNFASGSWFDSLFGKKNKQKDEFSPIPHVIDQPVTLPSNSLSAANASIVTGNEKEILPKQTLPTNLPKITDQIKQSPKNSSTGKMKPKRHANTTTTPSKHIYDAFLLKRIHESVDKFGSKTKLIFIGDLLFYKMSRNRTRWSELEMKYGAINLASPSDRTEHLLHRFSGGNVLSNITAKSPLVVAMFGSSNVNMNDSPTSILAGVAAVISMLKEFLIEPKIVLVSLPPRINTATSETVSETNKLLQSQYGDAKEKSVDYVDLTPIFVPGKDAVQSVFYGTDKNMPNLEGQVINFTESNFHLN